MSFGDDTLDPNNVPITSVAQLAQFIAQVIKKDNDIDNLGDGESIVLVDKCPTINLTELAERILNREWYFPNGKFKVNDHVWKEGKAYSGPGVVKAICHIDGKPRYIVAHKIEDGEGELLHIYSEDQLYHVKETPVTPQAKAQD